MSAEESSARPDADPGRAGERPHQAPDDEGNRIIDPSLLGDGPGTGTTVESPIGGSTAAALCANPDCGQPVEPSARFCQACGARLTPSAPTSAHPGGEEKPRPWLLLIALIWLVIAAAAFLFLYSQAFQIGRT
jgi:hypothetical protein